MDIQRKIQIYGFQDYNIDYLFMLILIEDNSLVERCESLVFGMLDCKSKVMI